MNKLVKQDIKIEQSNMMLLTNINKVYLNGKYIGVKLGNYFLTEKSLSAVYKNMPVLFGAFKILRLHYLEASEDPSMPDDARQLLEVLNQVNNEICYEGQSETKYYQELLDKAVNDILTEDEKS